MKMNIIHAIVHCNRERNEYVQRLTNGKYSLITNGKYSHKNTVFYN